MIEGISVSSGGSDIKVETTASFGQSAGWWLSNPKDILILRLPVDAGLETYFFKKIKNDLPPTQSVIFLAPNVSPALMQVANLLKKVRIIKTPVDPSALWKCIEELTTEYPRRQGATRYATFQEGLVRSELKEGFMLILIKNISNTGAYFECHSNSLDLETYEVFRMEVTVSGFKKYEFDCKVVWLKKLANGDYGFGVSFVNIDESFVSAMRGRSPRSN